MDLMDLMNLMDLMDVLIALVIILVGIIARIESLVFLFMAFPFGSQLFRHSFPVISFKSIINSTAFGFNSINSIRNECLK